MNQPNVTPSWEQIESSDKFKALPPETQQSHKAEYEKEFSASPQETSLQPEKQNPAYVPWEKISSSNKFKALPPETQQSHRAEWESDFLPEDRGFVGDVGSHVARGVARGAAMVGHGLELVDFTPTDIDEKQGLFDKAGSAIRKWGEDAPSRSGIYRPDIAEKDEGFFKSTFGSAVESAPLMAAPFALAKGGAMAGTAVAGPAGAVVGGVGGGLLGLVGTFFAGTYGESRKSAIDTLKERNPDMTDDEIKGKAHSHAMTSGLYEAVPEAASDILMYFTAGGSKLVTEGGKAALKSLLKGGPKDIGKRLLVGYAKNAPMEAGTEMLTEYGQKKSEMDVLGVGEGAQFSDYAHAAGAALWMAMGANVAGTSMDEFQSRKAFSAVNSDNPKSRADAVAYISGKINESTGDKELANRWQKEAIGLIQEGKEIPTGERIDTLSAQQATPTDPINNQQDLEDEIAKVEQELLTGQLDTESIPPVADPVEPFNPVLPGADQQGTVEGYSPFGENEAELRGEELMNTFAEGGVVENQTGIETHTTADGTVINRLTGELVSSPDVVATEEPPMPTEEPAESYEDQTINVPEDITGREAVDFVEAKNAGFTDEQAAKHASRKNKLQEQNEQKGQEQQEGQAETETEESGQERREITGESAGREKVDTIVKQITERSTIEDVSSLKAEMPGFIEQNQEFKPYRDLILGNLDRREAVLNNDLEKYTEAEKKIAGFEEANRQGASDEILTAMSDTAEDVKAQDDVKGRKQSFEKLKGELVVNESTANTVVDSKTGNINDKTPDIIEHKTKKGKIIKGIVRTDITLKEAKAIDKYTFRKDGGFFIRERHLKALEPTSDKSDGKTPETAKSDESKVGSMADRLVNMQDEQRVKALHGDIKMSQQAIEEWKANPNVSAEKKKAVIDKFTKRIADNESFLAELEGESKPDQETNSEPIEDFEEPAETPWDDEPLSDEQAADLADSTNTKPEKIDTTAEHAQEKPESVRDDQETVENENKTTVEPENTSDKGESGTKQGRESNYGQGNKLVSSSRADEIRAKLKEKLNQLSAGVDPEMISLGTELAVYHIEAGARKFTDFSKAMVNDLGGKIKPFLRSFYEGARYYPGLDNKEMSSATEIESESTSDVTDTNVGDKADSPKKKEPTVTKESFTKSLERKGTARDALGVDYKILQAEGDGKGNEGSFYYQSVEDGIRIEKGPGYPQRWSQAKAINDAVSDAHFGTETGQTKPESGTIKAGGKKNERILADVQGISKDKQSGRTGKTKEGRETSGVREGSDGTVRGSGTNDSRTDDKGTSGKLQGQGSKSETSKDGGKGAVEGRHEGVSSKPVDYHITDSDFLGSGGAAAKARQNIEAIRILKLIQKEKRPATPKEQKALVKYVGWGSSELANGIFPVNKWSHETRKSEPTYKKGWASNGKKLEKLLTKEEYADAKRSTLNAHYTSKEVIDGMYSALEQFGYKGGGKAIEPGSGVGHFVGLLPENMPDTKFTTVEMDSISAGIAEVLYPNHDIRNQDYAKFKAPKNFFDFAIGNPPFDSVPVLSDKEYAKHKFALHDFFFAKTIDRVRPGGVMMLVTSRYTMDKAGDKARHYLGKRADFLGAIRLPQTAFKKNAGTDVVTDVIFLQKRGEGKAKGGVPWGKLKTVKAKDKNKKSHEFSINEYFVDNPEMVIGSHAAEGSMYGANEYTVKPKQGEIGEHFVKAVQKLPKDIYEQGETVTDQDVAEVEFAPDIIKEGAFFLDDKGNVLQKEDGAGQAVPTAKGKKKALITDFISVRDAVREVLYVQLSETGSLKAAQRKLEKAYKEFVAEHGPINKATKVTRNLNDGTESISYRYPNFQPFSADPDSYRVAAIEIYDLETGNTKKADIFTERVISPAVEPKVESLTDALHVSMYQVGRVDVPEIAKLMNVSEQEAIDGLGDAIFHDPDGRKWVTDDDYLSGNVREKLENAKDAAEVDKKYKRNVKALESVQPEDLPASRVSISLGMPIVDKKHIEKFASEVLEMDVTVSQAPITNDWKVVAHSGQEAATATSDYGTPRRNAAALLDHALNGKSVTIRDQDSDGKTWVNKTATETANAKLQKLKTKFNSWIWEDANRADNLLRRYNDEYNNIVKREYGGDHINVMTFPGLSSSIKPYDHQKRTAWRIIQSGNTYMAHSVGAGKTIASIIAGMEQKRLGIKKKPVWVVPNHMLKQFSSEFLETYPAAKILVADEQQFTAKNRNRFMGKVAVENWDAIIITHSAFKKIPMSAEFQAQFIEEQLSEVEVIMQEAKDEGEYAKTKQIERQKKKLEGQLEKIMSGGEKDRGVTFEETGIDQIYVDEAHEYRKLSFVTKKGDLKGVDPNGSQLAFDLYTKTQYLESQTPGRSLVLMSGTPVTNTLGEVFAIQRFLQGDKLKDLGIDYFDGWAATFGDTVTNIEATPAGTYKPVTRFAKFNNMAALSGMWADVGDYVHAKDLHYITRPSIIGGSRNVVIGESSPVQKAYKKALGERIKAIERRTGPPQKGQDIILSVITDGRHAAMDDKYIDSATPDREDSKMSKMVGNVEKIWRDTVDTKSTQMVFADLGMPGSLEKRGFSTYLHIKEELIKRGIPENEIAFMQDYKKSDQKIKLYKDLNAGKVRVIIGSSQSMGTGVNAQKRLVALHHFDPNSYLPSNIEQREGRIVRQGNTNEKVHLYAYVTRGSYDETMWQFLETKQRFIDQFLSGKVGDDSVSDIDGASNSYAMAKAISSDNPLVLEMAGVENELNTLKSLYTGHLDSQRSLRFGKSKAQRRIESDEKLVKRIKAAIKNRIPTKGDAFGMKVDGVDYSDRSKAGKAFIQRQIDMIDGKIRFNERVKLGDIAGFGVWGTNVGLKGSYSSKVTAVDKESGLVVADFAWATKTELNEASPAGIVRQLENQAQGLDRRLERVKEEIEKDHGVIKGADERIGAKFEHQDTLEEKQKRLEEIKDELAKQESEGADGSETLDITDAVDQEAQENENTQNDIKKSVSVSPLPLSEQADTTKEIEQKIGKRGLRNLIKKGLLEVVSPQRAEQVLSMVGDAEFSVSGRENAPEIKYSKDGRIEGFYLNGKIYLVNGNIAKNQAISVLAHELAVHAKKLGFKDSKRFRRILAQLRKKSKQNNNEGREIRNAMARIPADTPIKDKPEETLAYLITNSPDISIVRKLIAQVKKFLIEKLDVDAAILSNIDLQALALGVVQREAKGHSPNPKTKVVKSADDYGSIIASKMANFSRNKAETGVPVNNDGVSTKPLSGGDTSVVKQIPNSSPADTELISNLSSGVEITPHAYNLLDVPTRLAVERRVLHWAKNNKVVDVVIGSGLVNVVDYLRRFEFSAESLLGNAPVMLDGNASYLGGKVPVKIDSAGSASGTGTVLGTTPDDATANTAGMDGKVFMADGTGGADNRQSVSFGRGSRLPKNISNYDKLQIEKLTTMPDRFLGAADHITSTVPFKKWFGDSKITSNGKPHILYHGTSDPRFLQDKDYPWIFNTDAPIRSASSPLAGLGIFVANDVDANAHSVGTPGTTHPFFVRIENPMVMTADELESKVNSVDSAKAFRKRAMDLNGYDGIIIKDRGQVIAFEKDQLKSASENSGEFSRDNPDVRYSVADATADLQEDTESAIGTAKEIVSGKTDSSMLERILSTAEYIFKKSGATKRMLQAQLDRRDETYKLEEKILGDFVSWVQKFKKEDGKAYKIANDYLLESDRTGETFNVRRGVGYRVEDPNGKFLGHSNTKEGAYKIAQDAQAGTNYLIKDHPVSEEKVEYYDVLDPKGKVLETVESESVAVEQMVNAEQEQLQADGYGEPARLGVQQFREMTNRAFDEMIADMRRVLEDAREAGLDEPTVETVDESKRWAVNQGGEVLGAFNSKEDAESSIRELGKYKGKYSNLTVEKQEDGAIRKEVGLSEAIAMMGDLRGSYFPRQRESGNMILRAVHPDGRKIMEKFDFYLADKTYIDPSTGEEIHRPKSRVLRQALNKATGKIPFIKVLEKRANQLSNKGFDVTWEKDKSTPESVFDAAQLMASVDALLNTAIDKAKKEGKGNDMQEINKILTANISDIFKTRGYLSSRAKRTEEYWTGFEEDMLLAGTQYAKGLASGFAKRDAAKKMVLAVTGRDKPFSKWQESNGDGTWDEYMDFVANRRLNPGEQKHLYSEAMGFMREVLRNQEQSDRIMGTMAGLAVLKFLAFRVSSAAVNMTNMVQAVPATISSHTKGSITDALKSVTNAANVYGRYRTGKNISDENRRIFEEISENGWDEAQFNQDNAAVLRTKLGNNWDKFMTGGMYLFSAVEKVNRATTIFAAYKQYRKNTSLTHEEAMKGAKETSDRAHGNYDKGNRPMWTRGAVNPMKMFYLFQKFSHNYMLNAWEMGFMGDYKQAAYMLLSPAILAGAGASLVTPLVSALLGSGSDEDPEEKFYEWAQETFGSDALFRHGLAGLLGFNLKGSLQIHNPMPTNLEELIGAPGGMVMDTAKSFGHIKRGEALKAVESAIPLGFGNMVKAVREGSEGITTGGYSSVYYGDEALKSDGFEQFLRFLSFNPSRISGIREKQWSEKQVARKVQSRRSIINAKAKRYQLNGTLKEHWPELRKEMFKYNEAVRALGRNDISEMTAKNLLSLLRSAKKPNKTERLRQAAS